MSAAMTVAATVAASIAPAAAEGPFAGYAGRWVGKGSVNTSSGKEPIQCRVTYFVEESGALLKQTIRCASDSYKFEVKSNVRAAGSKLSGTWEEVTRSVSGDLVGNLRGSDIKVGVTAPNFSASMAVNMGSGSQSVVITPVGLDVTEVSMTLRKG